MTEEYAYLLEFVRIGNQVKVTACDPDTGIEAVVFGPVSATKRDLSALAVRKLLYVLKKKQGGEASDLRDDGAQ